MTNVRFHPHLGGCVDPVSLSFFPYHSILRRFARVNMGNCWLVWWWRLRPRAGRPIWTFLCMLLPASQAAWLTFGPLKWLLMKVLVLLSSLIFSIVRWPCEPISCLPLHEKIVCGNDPLPTASSAFPCAHERRDVPA